MDKVQIKKEDKTEPCWEVKNYHPSGPLPAAKRRHMSPSPERLDRRGPISPAHKRKKITPLRKSNAISGKAKSKRHRTSSSSGSGSSDSSESDSGSSSSSSSDSTPRSRKHTPPKRGGRVPEKPSMHDRKLSKKEPPKKRSPISIEIKRPNAVGASALMSPPSHSNAFDNDSKKTRREELLKQLRAVEDAIAKKRSKLS